MLVIDNHIQNQSDCSGNTALHIACQNNTVDIVRYLIKEKECDPSIENHKNELPIHLACRHSLEMVKLVSNCVLKPTEANYMTLLDVACSEGILDIVKYLHKEWQCNLHTESSTSQYYDPLHFVCHLHKSRAEVTDAHIAIAKYLVTLCGCNPMKGKNDNDSPIETA